MRYLGGKSSLLGFIEEAVREHCPDSHTFADLFCGTAVVGRRFKELGYSVTANDVMAFPYAIARATIQSNTEPRFAGLPFAGASDPLQATLDHLNGLDPVQGFIWHHYSPAAGGKRMFFTPDNAGRIDAIRARLSEWQAAGSITEEEFYLLLAALLDAVPSVSNISGTYGAYLKFWEARSSKRLELARPSIVIAPGEHRALNEDANVVVRRLECDVLYLDPPYNGRQYAANYHILETIARGDEPAVVGVAGLPQRDSIRSRYCLRREAALALADLVRNASARHILLSYNSEGLIPHETIMAILRCKGRVCVMETPYRRFRSDADGPNRAYKANHVAERLYLVST